MSLAKTSQFIGIAVLAGCAHLPSQPRGQTAFWGFTGPWDRRSDSSVMEHASNLAQIITGWIALDTTSFRPVLLYPDSIGSLPTVSPRKTALIHMGINLSVVVIYVINFWMRLGNPSRPGLVWLSLLTIVLLVISGWLGGKMVYVYGIGVSEGGQPEERRERTRGHAYGGGE